MQDVWVDTAHLAEACMPADIDVLTFLTHSGTDTSSTMQLLLYP